VTAVVKAPSGTIAFYVSLEHERDVEVATRVVRAVRDAGFAVALCDGQEARLHLGTTGARVDDGVVLVTVGGDGTLLRAAQVAAPRGIPLFGINTGRLGFLTEVDANADVASALLKALRDGFVVEERLALVASLRGTTHFALNDVVVRRSATGHMAPFGLYVDDKEAARVPADGFIIATPTGSTAYLLSAGGPILAPDVAAFGIVALAPHTLFTRPLVVPDSSRITLVCAGELEHATLEADGRVVDELGPGERVNVTRYSRAVRFARRAPLNFFALLEDKMRWNAPIKGRQTGQ
jgi:NAD+ kinase